MTDTIAAEQGVIGTILNDNSLWPDASTKIEDEDFVRNDHKAIWDAMRKTIERFEVVDCITISEELNDYEFTARKSLMAYLWELQRNASPAAINAYIDIIQAEAQRRRLEQLFREQAQRLERREPVSEVLSDVSTDIDRIIDRGIGESKNFDVIMEESLKIAEEAASLKEQGRLPGVPTSIREIDDATGGIRPAKLWVMAARPSVGKTAFVNQLMLNASAKGHAVGMCSLEMSEQEIGSRSYAHLYGVNGTMLQHGERSALRDLSQKLIYNPLSERSLYYDCDTYDLNGIVARIGQWRRQYNITLAIVDHIGLIENSIGNNRNESIGHITRSLKKLSKKLNIGIIGVSQLNRSNEREERTPKLSDLRDSGNIEQDIDAALFLHRNGEPEGDTQPISFGLLKNRSGRTGWLRRYEYEFVGANQTFQEKPASAFNQEYDSSY